ncbi:sugar transport family protein [Companilactobacillus mindensis DSM 14500]|uniref:Sugar transport family protein n=1 Tax=Companilactobacillus mindensis DSM 14500 TaxID=1423770 RepID=A0A0R1QPS0_9LACO|nr:GRP family sugar transporter [Companilactobacillus mindensis]KRL42872.1 sugar transport family protein [Companilactobacillus mindensis DSM 14500]GEO78475.1 glucose uptake protein [Companilactobacillus mindensis]
MNILIALIPAIGWGFMPLITGKVGGSPANQMFGIGAGATIVGLISYLITQPSVSVTAFWFSVLCGALWTIGQIGQFISFKRIGVSGTVPLSTVFQLVGNSVIGMLIFGDWAGAQAKIIGILALVVVIIGALLTSVSDSTSGKKLEAKDVIFLLCTTVGFWIYSSFPSMPIVKNESGTGIFLPEMLGILLGAILYALFTDRKAFVQKEQYQNIIAGIFWGVAAFAYIFSAKANGNTSAFIWTQLNVVISTFGGIFVLHEQKSSRELKFTIGGILLIIIGSVATSFA